MFKCVTWKSNWGIGQRRLNKILKLIYYNKVGKIIDNLGFQGEERIQSKFLALGATTRSQKRHRSSDSDSGTADSIATTSNPHHYHVLKQSPGNLLIFFYPNWRGHCLNIINRILAHRCFWTNYVSLIWLVVSTSHPLKFNFVTNLIKYTLCQGLSYVCKFWSYFWHMPSVATA